MRTADFQRGSGVRMPRKTTKPSWQCRASCRRLLPAVVLIVPILSSSKQLVAALESRRASRAPSSNLHAADVARRPLGDYESGANPLVVGQALPGTALAVNTCPI
jgi:hypothetical protein